MYCPSIRQRIVGFSDLVQSVGSTKCDRSYVRERRIQWEVNGVLFLKPRVGSVCVSVFID